MSDKSGKIEDALIATVVAALAGALAWIFFLLLPVALIAAAWAGSWRYRTLREERAELERRFPALFGQDDQS